MPSLVNLQKKAARANLYSEVVQRKGSLKVPSSRKGDPRSTYWLFKGTIICGKPPSKDSTNRRNTRGSLSAEQVARGTVHKSNSATTLLKIFEIKIRRFTNIDANNDRVLISRQEMPITTASTTTTTRYAKMLLTTANS